MKSTLMTWRESVARLGALKQLRGNIDALRDYPSESKASMLGSLDQAIQEEERAAAELEQRLRPDEQEPPEPRG